MRKFHLSIVDGCITKETSKFAGTTYASHQDNLHSDLVSHPSCLEKI
jgi:hypothetical protein